LARQVGDLVKDHMANSTASIVIEPTTAFNRDDIFIFGSWVYTADDAGSFQHYLTMTPDLETGLVTLPEVVTGQLVDLEHQCMSVMALINRSTPVYWELEALEGTP
jgi:hypothetical protein